MAGNYVRSNQQESSLIKLLGDTLETMPQKQGLDPDVYRRVDIAVEPGKIGFFTINTIIGAPIGDAVLLGESNG